MPTQTMAAVRKTFGEVLTMYRGPAVRAFVGPVVIPLVFFSIFIYLLNTGYFDTFDFFVSGTCHACKKDGAGCPAEFVVCNGAYTRAHLFILSAFILCQFIVCYGTFNFLKDIFTNLIGRDRTARDQMLFAWARRLTVITLLISGACFLGLVLVSFGRLGFPYGKVIEINEFFLLITFFLFILIDSLTLAVVGDSPPYEKAFIVNSLCFIDITVFLSISAVFAINHMVFAEPGSIGAFTRNGWDWSELFRKRYAWSTSDVPPLDEYLWLFKFGFSAGAVIIHVVFSQIIFAVLKTRFYVAEERTKEDEIKRKARADAAKENEAKSANAKEGTTVVAPVG